MRSPASSSAPTTAGTDPGSTCRRMTTTRSATSRAGSEASYPPPAGLADLHDDLRRTRPGGPAASTRGTSPSSTAAPISGATSTAPGGEQLGEAGKVADAAEDARDLQLAVHERHHIQRRRAARDTQTTRCPPARRDRAACAGTKPRRWRRWRRRTRARRPARAAAPRAHRAARRARGLLRDVDDVDLRLAGARHLKREEPQRPPAPYDDIRPGTDPPALDGGQDRRPGLDEHGVERPDPVREPVQHPRGHADLVGERAVPAAADADLLAVGASVGATRRAGRAAPAADEHLGDDTRPDRERVGVRLSATVPDHSWPGISGYADSPLRR